MNKFFFPPSETLSKTVLDVCPDESHCAQMYSSVPRRSLPYSNTPYSSLTFPTLLQCSLLSPDIFLVPQVPSLCYSDAPYAFPTDSILLGFPECTTRTRSLPIRALLALPLS